MRALLIAIALTATCAAKAAPGQPVSPSSPEARRMMHGFGSCVADHSAKKASETLLMDFSTRAYKSALYSLIRANQDCFRRGRMRSANLLFAGAIAERLLSKDSTPLNVRLARAVSRPAPPARSPSESIAICIARSVPDDVARLFVTEVGTEAEAVAVRSLDLALRLCSSGKPRLETTLEGLRSMLATAAFRSVASHSGGRQTGSH